MQENKQEYINAQNLKHEFLAPIVLFVYNRPWHTQQTVEALQQNIYAAESQLIIYSDAAKDATATEKVQEVRNYIKNITGFKRVTIIEQTTNQGLANSIINGVTEIVNKYGRIIVLEDDIVTSKYFLKYMNDALEIYKNEDKVMEVAGFLYPIDTSDIKHPFFSRMFECWGWGTWKNAWQHFERNPEKLLKTFNKQMKYEFNIMNSYNYWSQVEENQSGKIYTWAIFWYATMFIKKALVLHPNKSLVNNVGFDGSGVHCGEYNKFQNATLSEEIKYFPRTIEEDHITLLKLYEFFNSIKPTILSRIKNRIQRIITS